MLFLVFFLAIATAQYADTNCARLRCTESELISRNYAKSLGMGTFACNASFVFYNPNLTINNSFTMPFGFTTRYNSTTGAMATTDPSGNLMAEEFCDDKEGICVIDYDPLLATFYTESVDIARGGRGNAGRFLYSVEKNSRKTVRRAQYLLAEKGGEKIIVWVFDEQGKIFFVGAQDCAKIGN